MLTYFNEVHFCRLMQLVFQILLQVDKKQIIRNGEFFFFPSSKGAYDRKCLRTDAVGHAFASSMRGVQSY